MIIDCDPGIDDAMALLLAARCEDLQIMGITTVFGNADIEVTTANAIYLSRLLLLTVFQYLMIRTSLN